MSLTLLKALWLLCGLHDAVNDQDWTETMKKKSFLSFSTKTKRKIGKQDTWYYLFSVVEVNQQSQRHLVYFLFRQMFKRTDVLALQHEENTQFYKLQYLELQSSGKYLAVY